MKSSEKNFNCFVVQNFWIFVQSWAWMTGKKIRRNKSQTTPLVPLFCVNISWLSTTSVEWLALVLAGPGDRTLFAFHTIQSQRSSVWHLNWHSSSALQFKSSRSFVNVSLRQSDAINIANEITSTGPFILFEIFRLPAPLIIHVMCAVLSKIAISTDVSKFFLFHSARVIYFVQRHEHKSTTPGYNELWAQKQTCKSNDRSAR